MALKEMTAALIGTGAISRALHLPAHSQVSGSRLKWVCNTSFESARSAAEQFGIPHWTVCLEDILNDPAVDWVDVAVPNEFHEEVTIKCLEAGKHVLCQKPMAPYVEAASRMISAAGRADRQLGVYMCFRGDPAVQLIRRMVREGSFGKLISMRGKMISDRGYQLRPGQWRMESASGALDLLGVHLIDLFSWIYGHIEWVQAYSATLHAPMKGDDVTTAIFGMAEGVTAVLESTYCSWLNEQTPLYVLEVNGTEGMAAYILDQGKLSLQLKENYRANTFSYEAGTCAAYTFEHSLWGGGSLSSVHQDFVDSLRSGSRFDISGEDGLRSIQIIEATRRAALEGNRVVLNAY